MRHRLHFDHWPAAVYAVGDVHGCLAQLLEMERRIIADAATFAGEKWLVTLGDCIDRGPNSAGVIAHLMTPPPQNFKRIPLIGNHEQMMLDFLDDPLAHAYWLDEGGTETLASYGVDLETRLAQDDADQDLSRLLARHIPREHIALLKFLPVCLSLPHWLFVHAGVRPGVALDRQTDEDLLWIRSPFNRAPLLAGTTVVHGHTPVREPFVTRHRLAIDSGCYRTGKLTAVRVMPNGGTRLFSVTG